MMTCERLINAAFFTMICNRFGLQAYLHLSVAFISMMKSITPATTMTGLALLGKVPQNNEVVSVMFICAGTLMSAYGEMHLTIIGLICIGVAEVCECKQCLMLCLLYSIDIGCRLFTHTHAVYCISLI